MDCVFLGRSTLDLLYQAPLFPAENTKITAACFLPQAGGPALNAAIAFASLGGTAHLVSAIGRGSWSNLLRAECERYGVLVTDILDSDDFVPPISSIVINAASGSRTIFNAPGTIAAHGVQLPPVSQLRGRFLLTDGFYLSEACGLVHSFKAQGGMVCLDGGSWKPELEELIPLVSIAICSEHFRPPGTRGEEQVLEYLTGRGVPFAAITRGQSEIIAKERGRRFSIAIDAVRAIDTLAAGDILHGAFCWYFLREGNFEAALRAAAKVATLSVQFLGAREWMNHLRPEF
ncbi:MAG: sugar kinase, partial [Acidobacteriia bacterium]|nr:sugar kinase [Terriglobia bacterium]